MSVVSNKILIVGGSGNLGSKIVNALVKKKTKIFILDKKKNLNLKNSKFIKCNLNNKFEKKIIPKKINVVILAAGIIGGEQSFAEKFAQKYIQNNFYSVLNLLNNIDRTHLKKIIFLSTEQIYGDNQINFLQNKFYEPQPKNYYGISKLLAEKALFNFYHNCEKKISIDILRVPRVIDYSKNNIIYNLIEKIKKNNKIVIRNFKEKFNLIFIDDFLKIIVKVSKHNKKEIRILDISGRDYRSFFLIEIIQKIKKKLGLKNIIYKKKTMDTHNPINLKINYNYSKKNIDFVPKISVSHMIKLIISKHGF